MALCPGLPRWAGTRKVKPIWILLKQETVSGSGISWAICKSAPRSRQITMPAPHHSVVLQARCPTNSVTALKQQNTRIHCAIMTKVKYVKLHQIQISCYSMAAQDHIATIAHLCNGIYLHAHVPLNLLTYQLAMGRQVPRRPFTWGIGTPSNTRFLGPQDSTPQKASRSV